ncbi:putative membrane protein [Candidatus Phytoplasma solani]|uniref:hypothetical protein n=1 Tax=Candidatus Phytoplasma solani TaxID=69896 RepID=UPI0032DADBD9
MNKRQINYKKILIYGIPILLLLLAMIGALGRYQGWFNVTPHRKKLDLEAEIRRLCNNEEGTFDKLLEDIAEIKYKTYPRLFLDSIKKEKEIGKLKKKFNNYKNEIKQKCEPEKAAEEQKETEARTAKDNLTGEIKTLKETTIPNKETQRAAEEQKETEARTAKDNLTGEIKTLKETTIPNKETQRAAEEQKETEARTAKDNLTGEIKTLKETTIPNKETQRAAEEQKETEARTAKDNLTGEIAELQNQISLKTQTQQEQANIETDAQKKKHEFISFFNFLQNGDPTQTLQLPTKLNEYKKELTRRQQVLDNKTKELKKELNEKEQQLEEKMQLRKLLIATQFLKQYYVEVKNLLAKQTQISKMFSHQRALSELEYYFKEIIEVTDSITNTNKKDDEKINKKITQTLAFVKKITNANLELLQNTDKNDISKKIILPYALCNNNNEEKLSINNQKFPEEINCINSKNIVDDKNIFFKWDDEIKSKFEKEFNNEQNKKLLEFKQLNWENFEKIFADEKSFINKFSPNNVNNGVLYRFFVIGCETVFVNNAYDPNLIDFLEKVFDFGLESRI